MQDRISSQRSLLSKAGILLVMSIASTILTSCLSTSVDPEELKTFCDSVKRYSYVLDELDDAMDDLAPFGEEEARFRRASANFEEVLAEIAESAPDNVSEDVETVLDYNSETLQVSEQEAYQDALGRVNTFIREDCDLNVRL